MQHLHKDGYTSHLSLASVWVYRYSLGSPVIFGAKACQKVEVSEAYPAYRPGAKVTHVPGPGRVDEGSS